MTKQAANRPIKRGESRIFLVGIHLFISRRHLIFCEASIYLKFIGVVYIINRCRDVNKKLLEGIFKPPLWLTGLVGQHNCAVITSEAIAVLHHYTLITDSSLLGL